MRRHLIIAAIALAVAACSPPSTATSGVETPAPSAAPLSETDRAGVFAALNLSPNAAGEVVNECGDSVTPAIVPAELGGAVGTAQLVAVPGGPSAYSCYGDGPDLHLMMREGGGWREIYAARGRMLIIMPGETSGVHDIADGGPGFQFPLWQWNGSAYANTGRSISDAELANATFLP